MRRCLTVTVLVCLWTTAACDGYGWDVTPRYIQGTPYDFSDDEKEAIVGEHNDIRASLRARNMLKLEWDEDLAAIASSYAQECTFNYNPHRHDLSTFSYVGENIAAIDSTGVHDPGPVYKVSGTGEARINTEYFVASVRRWFHDDAPFYLYNYHQCNSLARCQCRFYLQMVWAETCSVGCGVAFCPFVKYYSAPDVYLLICNYGPGRNLLKHVHDPPYEAGRHGCDDCPDGYECSDSGLCVSDSNTTVCGVYRVRDDEEDSDSSSSDSSSESTDTTATGHSESSRGGSGRSGSSGSDQSGSDRSGHGSSDGSDRGGSSSSGRSDTTRSDSSNRTRTDNDQSGSGRSRNSRDGSGRDGHGRSGSNGSDESENESEDESGHGSSRSGRNQTEDDSRDGSSHGESQEESRSRSRSGSHSEGGGESESSSSSSESGESGHSRP